MVRWGLVAVALGALVLTACGSDYAYVSNRDAGAYFKVPDGWEVYGEPEVLRAQDTSLSDREADDLAELVWVRGFDSARDPAPEHLADPGAGAPRGVAEVREVGSRERDDLSYAAMRRIGFPFEDSAGEPLDPLEYEARDPDGPIRVLDYDDGREDGALGDLSLEDGMRGIRLRTRVAVDVANPVVVEQITVVDTHTERRYSFTVGCSRDCWEANDDLIRTVADSWTLEPRT